MSDWRVEDVAKAIYTVHKGRVSDRPLSWEQFAEQEPRIADEYRGEARAAVNVIDADKTSFDALMDLDAFASEFGDQLNDRMDLGWHLESIGTQMQLRTAIKTSLRVAIAEALKVEKGKD